MSTTANHIEELREQAYRDVCGIMMHTNGATEEDFDRQMKEVLEYPDMSAEQESAQNTQRTAHSLGKHTSVMNNVKQAIHLHCR